MRSKTKPDKEHNMPDMEHLNGIKPDKSKGKDDMEKHLNGIERGTGSWKAA